MTDDWDRPVARLRSAVVYRFKIHRRDTEDTEFRDLTEDRWPAVVRLPSAVVHNFTIEALSTPWSDKTFSTEAVNELSLLPLREKARMRGVRFGTLTSFLSRQRERME
jgi:hypothetical protein